MKAKISKEPASFLQPCAQIACLKGNSRKKNTYEKWVEKKNEWLKAIQIYF